MQSLIKIDIKSLLTGAAALALVTTFALTPYSFSFNEDGYLQLSKVSAFAKDGHDDDDDDDDDNRSGSNRGSDDDDDDDDHHSSGSHDDDDDDHHSDGQHSGDDDGPDHDMNDDNGGDRNNNSSSNTPSSGSSVNDFLAAMSSGASVVKAEKSANEIEVIYSGGWKEEISNGRYELKNPAGRTIMQRQATQADLDRLNSVF